uniref:LBH domain-containing protein n=1 Tax=Electrophorus electricus TaxID=8005 RepID=A0A4W4GKI8_ELEEL
MIFKILGVLIILSLSVSFTFCVCSAMASSQQDSSTEELHLHRREECTPYQIFPDSSEGPELMSLMHQRRRLPSIVVDPTQVEQGRGELPWPLQRRSSREEEEDDSLEALKDKME